jgi:hypothetical protein
MRKVTAFAIVLGTAAAVAGTWGACKSPTTPEGILLTGSWGSEQGRLTATEVSTSFTGPCGSGSTREPIMLDRHGSFSMIGSYGPAGSARGEARFMGAVGSHVITLRVKMADSSQALAPITMRLNQQPTLGSCQ